jgi:hypothetical protein
MHRIGYDIVWRWSSFWFWLGIGLALDQLTLGAASSLALGGIVGSDGNRILPTSLLASLSPG